MSLSNPDMRTLFTIAVKRPKVRKVAVPAAKIIRPRKGGGYRRDNRKIVAEN